MFRPTDPYNNHLEKHYRKINVKYTADYHVIYLSTHWNPIVIDLAREIERVLKIPYDNQRLYFNGQELKLSPYDCLDRFHCFNNSTVTLVNNPDGCGKYLIKR
jgi:hypothetical protein